MRRIVKTFINSVVEGLSFEFVLRWLPNGGTAIFIRTCLMSALIYLIAIGMTSITRDGAALAFSGPRLLSAIHTTVPWVGAICAAVYVALYARFAAQWSYLAALYNQMMAACVSTANWTEEQKDYFTQWQAGFIEDAHCLHLASKPMFAAVVRVMLTDPKVVEAFVASTVDGQAVLAHIRKRVAMVAPQAPTS